MATPKTNGTRKYTAPTVGGIIKSHSSEHGSILFFFLNVYSFFERQSVNRGGAEREGDTVSEASPGSNRA